jgi:hypothetical protein
LLRRASSERNAEKSHSLIISLSVFYFGPPGSSEFVLQLTKNAELRRK